MVSRLKKLLIVLVMFVTPLCAVRGWLPDYKAVRLKGSVIDPKMVNLNEARIYYFNWLLPKVLNVIISVKDNKPLFLSQEECNELDRFPGYEIVLVSGIEQSAHRSMCYLLEGMGIVKKSTY